MSVFGAVVAISMRRAGFREGNFLLALLAAVMPPSVTERTLPSGLGYQSAEQMNEALATALLDAAAEGSLLPGGGAAAAK